MLPANRKSLTPVLSDQPGRFPAPDSDVLGPLVDYELGGTALNDPSAGLQVQTWTLTYEDASVICTPKAGEPSVLFSTGGITELALAFDQNMRPNVAYLKDGNLYLWWWDTTISQRVTTNFGAGRSPRLTLDDKRSTQSANSDIIFAYLRNDGLYYRQQRDRFLTERLLQAGLSPDTRLKNVGMSRVLRLQFELL